jgi:hypothetical protein
MANQTDTGPVVGDRTEPRERFRRARRPSVLLLSPLAKTVVVGVVAFLVVAVGSAVIVFGGGEAAGRDQAADDAGTGGANGSGQEDGTPKDPYKGTPAAAYQVGAAGLTMPPAKALGPWSAADVTAVVTKTRDTLVAARLDPRVLTKREVTGYVTRLAPKTRATVEKQIRGGEPALGYVTRLAPGFTLLVPEIRTKGKLAVTLGRAQQLVVTADVVWVYPLGGPKAESLKGAGSNLVVLRATESYEWYKPDRLSKDDLGLRPGAASISYVNMDCAQIKRGVIALPQTDQGGLPSDKAFDPETKPGSLPNTC